MTKHAYNVELVNWRYLSIARSVIVDFFTLRKNRQEKDPQLLTNFEHWRTSSNHDKYKLSLLLQLIKVVKYKDLGHSNLFPLSTIFLSCMIIWWSRVVHTHYFKYKMKEQTKSFTLQSFLIHIFIVISRNTLRNNRSYMTSNYFLKRFVFLSVIFRSNTKFTNVCYTATKIVVMCVRLFLHFTQQ